MKKSVLGLLITVACVLAVVSCTGNPPPKPPDPPTATITTPGTTTTGTTTTSTTPTAPTVEQSRGLVLDNAVNYTVVKGDTLSGIAAMKYGGSNMFFFPLIRLANASIVPNPDLIEVETRLVIPDLQRNLNNDGAKALLKADMLSIAGQYERQSKPNSAAKLRSIANKL